MKSVSHLFIALPNHSRTDTNPLGLGQLQYCQNKQITMRSADAFFHMVHPGKNYHLCQIVANKNHVTNDTAPDKMLRPTPKNKLNGEMQRDEPASYPGDLFIGKCNVDNIDIETFRATMKSYADNAALTSEVPDARNILKACLNILDRQLIPGGNPSFASDILRLMHQLISIEKIKQGDLDACVYTDFDSHTAMASMSQLSASDRISTLDPDTVTPETLANAAALCPPGAEGKAFNYNEKRADTPLPVEYRGTYIDNPSDQPPPSIKDERRRKFYSNHDLGYMHVSGNSATKAELNTIRNKIFGHLRKAVLRYEACFQPLGTPQAAQFKLEDRTPILSERLERADKASGQDFIPESHDALKSTLAAAHEHMSLGDLGRSLHRTLPLNIIDGNKGSTSGDLLVVSVLAKVLLASLNDSPTPKTVVEGMLYPVRKQTTMARLRYDFFNGFYEDSWRNRNQQMLPLTARLLKRLTEKQDQTQRASASNHCPPVQNTCTEKPRPLSRISSDTSDLPAYLLNRENRGI